MFGCLVAIVQWLVCGYRRIALQCRDAIRFDESMLSMFRILLVARPTPKTALRQDRHMFRPARTYRGLCP